MSRAADEINLSNINTLIQFWHICPALLVRVPCPFEVFGWSKRAQRVATVVA